MTVELDHEIKRYVTAESFPDSDTYSSLSVENVIRLSRQFKLPGKEIELAALDADIIPERYARNMKSYTILGFVCLIDINE